MLCAVCSGSSSAASSSCQLLPSFFFWPLKGPLVSVIPAGVPGYEHPSNSFKNVIASSGKVNPGTRPCNSTYVVVSANRLGVMME